MLDETVTLVLPKLFVEVTPEVAKSLENLNKGIFVKLVNDKQLIVDSGTYFILKLII